MYTHGELPSPLHHARSATRYEVLSDGRELYNGDNYDEAVTLYRVACKLTSATFYVWWQDTRVRV